MSASDGYVEHEAEPPPDDHRCAWRTEAEALRGRVGELDGKLAALTAAMEALTRRVLGPTSEKMPPPEKELRKDEPDEDAEARRLAGLARRRDRAALRAKLQSQTVIHHLADEQRECPGCGGTADRPLGAGKETFLFEYVPGYFVRQRHVQEKAACTCGQFIATADPPMRPVDGGHYGAGFMAHIAVMKCADSIPLHRLAKQYQRLGVPMSRSTLTDLFHATAEKLAPLSQRLVQLVAQCDIVQADETSLVMQKPFKRGFVWTFLSDEVIAYRFAPNRSGETPLAILGGSQGTLVVDAYTGYNRVVDVDGRSRSSCLAHVRRRFFEALTTKPVEARRGLDPLPWTVWLRRHHVPRRGRRRAGLLSNREKSCLKFLRSDSVGSRDVAGGVGVGWIVAHSSTHRRRASEKLMPSRPARRLNTTSWRSESLTATRVSFGSFVGRPPAMSIVIQKPFHRGQPHAALAICVVLDS